MSTLPQRLSLPAASCHLPGVAWWGISVSAAVHATAIVTAVGLSNSVWHAAQVVPPREGSHPVIALSKSAPANEPIEQAIQLATATDASDKPVPNLTAQTWQNRSDHAHQRDGMLTASPATPSTLIGRHHAIPISARRKVASTAAPEPLPPRNFARSRLPRVAAYADHAVATERPPPTSAMHDSAGVKTTALPRSVFSPHPIYPADALSRGETGRVVLRVHVDTTGRVTDVSIDRSSGSVSLDTAAIEAIRRWRFAPATGEGQPIDCEVRIPVRFRLER